MTNLAQELNTNASVALQLKHSEWIASIINKCKASANNGLFELRVNILTSQIDQTIEDLKKYGFNCSIVNRLKSPVLIVKW